MSLIIDQELAELDPVESIDSSYLRKIFSLEKNSKANDWPNSREGVWKRKRSGIELFVGDFHTLKPGEWLNGEIFETYLKEVASQSLEPIAVLSTFVCELLSVSVDRACKGFKKSLAKLTKDQLVLIPIKLVGHWALAAILPNEDCIRYFDGMGKKMRPEWMMERVRKMFQMIGFLQDGNIIYEVGIPTQSNGYDCGIFACQYGKALIEHKDMSFSEDMMPTFRFEIGIFLLQTRGAIPGGNIYRDPIITQEMLDDEEECDVNSDAEIACDKDDGDITDQGKQEDVERFREVQDVQDSFDDLKIEDTKPVKEIFPISNLVGSMEKLVFSVRQNANLNLAMNATLIEQLRLQDAVAFVDTDEEGNDYTANMNGDWKRSLRMMEVLMILGDEAWDIIKADIKENPALALNWCANAQVVQEGVARHPLRFSFGKRWNFLNVKSILENMYGIKVEDKSSSSRTARKNAKRKLKKASPYRQVFFIIIFFIFHPFLGPML